MDAALGQRIIVVGTSGSGKTTLARWLGQHLGVPHVELDALHWEPNWVEAPPEVFRERVAVALADERWVIDGNYSNVRDLVWPRAETLVWLDYPLFIILWRLMRRTIGRVFSRQELWNGNYERFRMAFLSRDSIILWALSSHRRHRRLYPEVFARSDYAHLQVIRLRSPRATRRWQRHLVATVAPGEVLSIT